MTKEKVTERKDTKHNESKMKVWTGEDMTGREWFGSEGASKPFKYYPTSQQTIPPKEIH